MNRWFVVQTRPKGEELALHGQDEKEVQRQVLSRSPGVPLRHQEKTHGAEEDHGEEEEEEEEVKGGEGVGDGAPVHYRPQREPEVKEQ